MTRWQVTLLILIIFCTKAFAQQSFVLSAPRGKLKVIVITGKPETLKLKFVKMESMLRNMEVTTG